MLVLLLTTGCWDARSLDQRAFVVMMGIDTAPEGRFKVSMQLQRAGFEQQRPEGKGTVPAATVLVAEGGTVRQALEKAREDLARELDTTFLDVFVLSQAVAREHLDELDWVVRTFRVPVSAFVTVTPGEAEPVLRAKAIGFQMPAQFAIFSQMGGQWSRASAVVPGLMWMMFNRNFFTPLEDPFAPVLTTAGDQLGWEGLAVFRGHRLAGLLTEQEASAFNLLLSSRAERIITADVGGGARATLYVQAVRVKRKVLWEQDRPVIQVRLSARGLVEELTHMRLTSREQEEAVEGALASQLVREVEALLRRLQELESDPVGFGELARQAGPYRREVRSGDAWRAAYRNARIDVTARVTMVSPRYMK